MENIELLNDFDSNNYSEIDDYLKPTDTNIQKDFVESITKLSNLISNGLLFVNYGIYENISNKNKNNNGSTYIVPKDCKILSNVVSKGIRKDSLKNYRKSINEFNSSSKSNSKSSSTNSINIIVTDTDKVNELVDDGDIFVNDQSMIRLHSDFSFVDSSMLFDQSAIFDLQGDNVGNQSMIFMDTNGRNIFTHEDPSNRNLLNINGLTENAEGNNSTLVNLTDVDNNYLSTSDNESNNSTAYWTDDRIPGPVNDPEEYSGDEGDDQLMDEFNQAFAKKKYASLDSQDLKNLVYPRPNSRQKNIRNTYPPTSTIQVNQYQVFPEPWNEYDDINLAKATIMKQNYKNGFPHKKLYPVAETPNDEINTNSSPYSKGYVNIYKNNKSNDSMNSSFSFIKDELSITKDIVNKNIKKFNSMGLENENDVSFQRGQSSNFSFSNISFTSSTNITPDSTPKLVPTSVSLPSNSEFAFSNLNRTNASSPQPSLPKTVNNFAAIQSKFNQPLMEDNEQFNTSAQSNHVWKYKTKQQSLSSQEMNDLVEDVMDNHLSSQAMNDFSSSVNTTIIKESDGEDGLNESIGTVKNLITGIESNIKMENEIQNSEIPTESVISMETEINGIKKEGESEDKELIQFLSNEETEEEQPLEFLSDHEEVKEQQLEFLSDYDEGEEEPIEFIQDNEEIEGEGDQRKLTETIINDNIIDDDLEGHIVIEEEDSIVVNAIEEALENKSFVIQEHVFMDEPFTNDLTYSCDGHSAFHDAMKFLEDGSSTLETIQEEDEEEIEENFVEKEECEVINTGDNHNNEEKIFKMIESNITEPEEVVENNKVNSHEIDTKVSEHENKIPSNIKVEPIENESEEVIDSDLKAIAKELEEMMEESHTNNKNIEKSVKKVKKINRTPLRSIKKETSKKTVVKNPLSNKKTSTSKETIQPKRVIKKTSKPLVLPTRNLIPSVKIDKNAGNCVKAFTSASLKQNVINTRPVEHEVALSFTEFNKNVNSKPKTKSIIKSKVRSVAKPISKSTVKSITKPVITKTTSKLSNKTSGPKVKPLTRSKNVRMDTKQPKTTIQSKTKSANRKVAAEEKKVNTYRKRTISRNNNTINEEYHHITYFPKVKRKSITQYPSDIRSKEKLYYQWVKDLLPEYSHKFAKYELVETMSRSYLFEAIIRKLSPEYSSSDYNPRRNVFRSLLPLDNINKFNEVLDYMQNHMKITIVITSYDLHFGNLSSIFIIIKQLQRYEANH
ncbi:hypothetical protein H8356DRAFT_1626280 [Neocallimastix lanati (nom. inval.)]|nr:hypothetical protein H8356DRAFT_1626280 [Neocallimastix sp. JGI-2020a]